MYLMNGTWSILVVKRARSKRDGRYILWFSSGSVANKVAGIDSAVFDPVLQYEFPKGRFSKNQPRLHKEIVGHLLP